MSAFVLAGLLFAAGADDAKLLERLDAEFESLLREDPNAAELRKAAQLLEETNQSSHWTNYSKATALLRETRSKAAVPLLLKYMVKHAELSTAHVTVPEYASTISLLTGKDIGKVYESGSGGPKAVRQRVAELFNEWWLPSKDAISTAPGKMSRQRLEVLVDRLLGKIRWARDYDRDPGGQATAYRIYHVLFYRVMNGYTSDEPPWRDAELDAAMVPILLARAGYQPEPVKPKDAGQVRRVPFAVVDLLAALRKNQWAPQLDRIAADSKQGSATRLTCVLAMYAAGEELNTPALIAILNAETQLELRLVTIIALMHSRETKQVVPRLIELLDDRNAEIRTAAVCALRGHDPPEAVPKLKKMIDELEPRQAMVFIFDTIGEIRTMEAKEALADFMQAALKDPRKSEHLSNALDAFETATDQRWRTAGAHDDAYYRERVREALAWWKKERAISGPAVSSELRQTVKTWDRDRNGLVDERRTTYLRGSEELLVCVERLSDDGSPETVANYVYYQGHVAYMDVLMLRDPRSYSARWLADSGVSVGIHRDATSDDEHMLLTDPRGEVFAVIGRDLKGRLTPLGREDFQRVVRKHRASQALAEQLLQVSPASDEDEGR